MTASLLAFLPVALLLTLIPGADTALVTRNALAMGLRGARWTILGIAAGCLTHATMSALGLSAILATSARAYEAVKLVGAVYLVWIGVQSIRQARAGGRPGSLAGVGDTSADSSTAGLRPSARNDTDSGLRPSARNDTDSGLRPSARNDTDSGLRPSARNDTSRSNSERAERVEEPATLPPHEGHPFTQGFLTNILNPKVALFYLTFLPQFIPAGAPVLRTSLLLAMIHNLLGFAWLSLYARFVDRLRVTLARPAVKGWLERVTGGALVLLGARLAWDRR
jgi:threonine/homoserine/homoserine lactone efflux protein